jgi:hypothetical protein
MARIGCFCSFTGMFYNKAVHPEVVAIVVGKRCWRVAHDIRL